MKFWYRILPPFAALAATAVIAALTVVAGAYYYLLPSLPSAETLRAVELQIPLRIYSRDGKLMDQIGEKRRTPVEYENIPEVVISAFLAAEDDRFFEHPGFDYQGIARASMNLILTGSRSQGGSTITQQLARVYFLTRERTFVRKAKELFLAVQIEREFSKEEILSLYMNKIFLGQRAYGVGAASEVYFGKSLQQINLAEAAMIAGLPKAPSALNPVSNPQNAETRRSYVLRRMLELDFIDSVQYDEAVSWPVESRLHGPKVELRAPYVTEMVRAKMVGRFGMEAYTAGYKVTTTIDSRLQKAAQWALRTALLEYDRRHGYRGPIANIELEDLDLSEPSPGETPSDEQNEFPLADYEKYLQRLLNAYPNLDELHIAVVLATADDNSAEIFVSDVGRIIVPWDNIKWRPHIDDNNVGAMPASADDIIKKGDLIYVLGTIDKGWVLAQMPEVQGAFVALDPRDGATAALTGGFNFFASKFNRAVQAKRQPGSSFKPFIYSAALENGFTTATLVNDAPVVFDDAALESTWRPQNYSRKFHGPTRLREALVRSLNLVSVRILQGTGLGPALRHLNPFGLPASALPRNLSLALGSGGASPWDLAAGYAVFANGGYHTEHYLIDRAENSGGQIVFQPDHAYVCQYCDSTPMADLGQPTDLNLSSDSSSRPEGIVPAVAEINIVPIDEASAVDDEVPAYTDVAEMIAHGMEWRPTAEEAPRFHSASGNTASRVISAENAYLIYDMMRDVIKRGTGRRARELGRPDLAGKTGTSNDRRDAWFSGFNGDIVATAWVGFDQDRSLGAGEEGSRTALPVWKYFMGEALAGTPMALMPRPPGIITVRIVPESGLVAPAGYNGAIFELFRDGNVPTLQTEDSSSEFTAGPIDDFGGEDENIF